MASFSVTYTHRILCDLDFVKWLREHENGSVLFSHLLHIRCSSEQWKRNHNLILSSEVGLGDDSIMPDGMKSIGAFFKVTEDPEILKNYEDQKTKNIIFSIQLAEERPFKCYLFTSPEKEQFYKSNPHYQEISSVEVVSGDKSVKIINDFFQAFHQKRINRW